MERGVIYEYRKMLKRWRLNEREAYKLGGKLPLFIAFLQAFQQLNQSEQALLYELYYKRAEIVARKAEAHDRVELPLVEDIAREKKIKKGVLQKKILQTQYKLFKIMNVLIERQEIECEVMVLAGYQYVTKKDNGAIIVEVTDVLTGETIVQQEMMTGTTV